MEAWRRLPAEYESGLDVTPWVPPDLAGERGRWLAATLPVLDLALGSVAALCSAVARTGADDGASTALTSSGAVPARVAASFGSDRLLLLDGRPVEGFAPLSGFFRTADGWLRAHANYPHHRARLLHLLGLPDGTDRAGLAERLLDRSGAGLEVAAADAGAVVVHVRDEATWGASEAGAASREHPLVHVTTRDDPVSGRRPGPGTGLGSGPLAGVRVLDLTRAIAGPVATRALAQLGADVLRVDPPTPAEIRWQHLDTGQGKWSTLLDLHDDGDREHAQRLLDDADVLVTGYRPGAVEAFRLRPRPGVVHARVNAWGDSGPWAGRRGFDSIVQAASGIATIESGDGATPGALPAQALDHATGYLLAAGVVDALTARAADGAGRDVVASLARTAAWLLDADGRDRAHPPAAVPPPGATTSHGHQPRVTTARPALPGVDDHRAPAHAWGSDHASWSDVATAGGAPEPLL